MYQIPPAQIPNMAGVLAAATASGAQTLATLQNSLRKLSEGKKDLEQFAAKQMLVESMKKRAAAEDQANKKKITDEVQKELSKILRDPKSTKMVRPIEFSDAYKHLYDPRDTFGSANKLQALLMRGGRLTEDAAFEASRSMLTESPVLWVDPEVVFEMMDRLVNEGQFEVSEATKMLEIFTKGAYVGDGDLRDGMAKRVDDFFKQTFQVTSSAGNQTVINMPDAENALKGDVGLLGPGRLKLTPELMGIMSQAGQVMKTSEYDSLKGAASGTQNLYLNRGQEGAWSLVTGGGEPVVSEAGVAASKLNENPFLKSILDVADQLGGQVSSSEVRKELRRQLGEKSDREKAERLERKLSSMYRKGSSSGFEEEMQKQEDANRNFLLKNLGFMAYDAEKAEKEKKEREEAEKERNAFLNPDETIKSGKAGRYLYDE